MQSLIETITRALKNNDRTVEPPLDSLFDPLKDFALQWLDRNLLWIMNYYPPYLGAGIQIDDYTPDIRYIRVKMNLNWWNQNYVGTQFGGSLYSMCDPFYMLMVMKNLGTDYEVWDKSAEINFLKPGRSTVYAEFELNENDLEQIRQEIEKNGVSEPVFTVTVKTENGQHMARINKELHVTTN
ncbi:MAG: DUF4442 domain-containing protein [bacterium]